MKAKRRYIPNFEARSVMLFAACAWGTAMGVHAQTPNSPASHVRSGSGHIVAQATVAPSATVGAGATSQAAPAPAAPVAATGSAGVEAAAFARADKDRDGKLSRAEAEQLPAVLQRFDQIDTNKDNFLSREEFDKGTKS